MAAIFKPRDFERLASRVQDSIVKVRRSCEEMVSFRVEEIKRMNDGQYSHVSWHTLA